MSFRKNNNLPLGKLLQQAGLISPEELDKALEIQSHYTKMKLGEILVLQETIKAETINFFVDRWQNLREKGQQFPLGYYFKKASLLNDEQIKTILTEQKTKQLKFGDLAVSKGWLKRETIDFFLDELSLKAPQRMSLLDLEAYDRDFLQLAKKYSNVSLILTRVLAWTGGDPILTKTICNVFASSDLNIPPGKEIKAVDKLIESSIIRNWQTSKLGTYIRAIKESLINNQKCQPALLLTEYQDILLSNNPQYRETQEQQELLNIGIVIRERDKVRVTNLIFQQVFNQNWLVQNQKTLESQIERKVESSRDHEVLELNASNVSDITINPSNSENILADRSVLNPDKSQEIVIQNAQLELQSNIKKTSPLTKISSRLTLIGIALFIPLVLAINNYYSSLKSTTESETNTLLEEERLEQFCQEINTINPPSVLDLIFQLERNKAAFSNSSGDSTSTKFPASCQTALNNLYLLAAPQLGKENRVIEAIKHLCAIPSDADNLNEAAIWLEHWERSASWGQETKSYLRRVDDCPARDI